MSLYKWKNSLLASSSWIYDLDKIIKFMIQNELNSIQRLNRVSSYDTLSEENDTIQYKKYIFAKYSWFLKLRIFSWRAKIVKYDITRRCFASISHVEWIINK